MIKKTYTKLNQFWSNHQFLVWVLAIVLGYIGIDKLLIKIINLFGNLLSLFGYIRDYILYTDIMFQHVNKINETYMASILIFIIGFTLIILQIIGIPLIKEKNKKLFSEKELFTLLIIPMLLYASLSEIYTFKYENKEDLIIKTNLLNPFIDENIKKDINTQLYNIDSKKDFDLLSNKIDLLIESNIK